MTSSADDNAAGAAKVIGGMAATLQAGAGDEPLLALAARKIGG